MTAERLGGGGGSGSKFETKLANNIKRASTTGFSAEANLKKAEEAAQTAQSAIAAAKRQESQKTTADKKDDQNTQYIDLSAGTVDSGRIEHEEPKQQDAPEKQESAEKQEAVNELDQLSDVELKTRSKEATTKLKNTTLGTPEFEEARRQVLEIAKEKNNRYRTRKAQENSANLHEQETQKINIVPVPAAQAVDKAVASAEQPEVIPNPIKGPNEVENEKLSLRERLKKTKVWRKVVSGVVATALLVGAVGVGAKALDANKAAAEAHADNNIEQEHNAEIKAGAPESYRGVFADEAGVNYNQEKAGIYDFAPGHMLGDANGNEQATKAALQRVALQTETLASYVHNLNAEDSAALGLREGMSLQEINNMLESNDDFRQAVSSKFNQMLGDAEISWSTVTGSYDNVYMAKNDVNQSVTQENTSLVACTTQEDGTQVVVVKFANGSIKTIKMQCAQPLDEQGKMNLSGTPTITPGDNPTPTPTPPPSPVPPGPTPVPPGPTPWGKSGDTHAGDGIFNKDLVNPASEVTEQQSDHANDGNKGGQSAAEVDHGVVDRGGNQKQETSPDRGVHHSDAEQESRIHSGDF